jgi:iron complex transport system substrate-binding protein
MYIADYLEENPLGKAEWIIPFGEMFNKTEEAKATFDGIQSRYEALRDKAAAIADKPAVMLNAPYRDVWFVPGDGSYMVQLINDAGGSYVCAGEDSAVSRPISGEAAYMAVSRADVWINPNQAASLEEVKTQNPKFADVRSIKTGRVYNATKRNTPGGGSDFWESGALRADRALEDLIICLHPESDIVAGGETYYFEQLQ